MLVMMGAGPSIVGVDGPVSESILGRNVPEVGDFEQIHAELILALKPTYVLMSGDQTIPELNSFKIPVYQYDPKTLEDIAASLKTLGVISGHTKTATQLATRYLNTLATLQPKPWSSKNPNSPHPRPTVFLEVGQDPFYTLTHASLQGQLIQKCGGINIFGTLSGPSAPVHLESILKANPDWILSTVPNSITYWSQYPTLTAVKNHHVVQLDPNAFSERTPHLLNTLHLFCEVAISTKAVA
jgi:ABC-type Fe3+-hydroxamate transport system substrate-binding protein